MTLTKDEILEQIADAYVSDDSDTAFNTALQRSFDAGYKDGQSVMPKWTEITSEDDLPPIGQRAIMVSNRAGDRFIYDYVVWSESHILYAGPTFNDYVAWMPIPSYEPAPHRDIPTEKVSQSTEGGE